MECQTSEVIEAFGELIKLSLLEIERCPWIADQNYESFLIELTSEIKEVQEAANKSERTSELGDLFRDALLVLLTAVRDEQADSLVKILHGITTKIKRRKPWLFSDEPITKARAEEIWDQVKAEEHAK